MNKFLVKTVAVTAAATMLLSNAAIFGYNAPLNEQSGIMLTQSKEVNNLNYRGKISEINKNKVTIGQNSNKLSFRITEDTIIKDENDKVIKLSNLKVGQEVDIEYDRYSKLNSNKTYEAKTIEVERESIMTEKASIEEITKVNKVNYVTISFETLNNKNKIQTLKLVINDDTEINDQFGNDIKVQELKEGMAVSVEYSVKMTKSIPAQTVAYNINVLRENNQSAIKTGEVLEKITYNKLNYLLVEVNEKSYNKIKFAISDDTKLRDEDGKTIKFSEIKSGQNVIVEHSNAMTRSSIPQCVAYTVQITDETDEPVIKPNPENCKICDLLYQLSEEIGKEEFINCMENHKHNYKFDLDELFDNSNHNHNNDDDMDYDDDRDDDEISSILGYIESINIGNNTIKVKLSNSNKSVTVYINKNTEIEDKNGNDITLNKLNKNDKIRIEIEVKSDKLYADEIKITK